MIVAVRAYQTLGTSPRPNGLRQVYAADVEHLRHDIGRAHYVGAIATRA